MCDVLKGSFPELWRCVPATSQASYGASGWRFPWEHPALCSWNYFWIHQGLQTLELQQGRDTHVYIYIRCKCMLWIVVCLTGGKSLGSALSTSPYGPFQYHHWDVFGLGHLHRHCLCKKTCSFDFPNREYFFTSSIYRQILCVLQESRDPRKLHWLFETLMESPVKGGGGSFVDAWLDITTHFRWITPLKIAFIYIYVFFSLSLMSVICMCCREVLLSSSGESQNFFIGYCNTWSPNSLRSTRTYVSASAGMCVNFPNLNLKRHNCALSFDPPILSCFPACSPTSSCSTWTCRTLGPQHLLASESSQSVCWLDSSRWRREKKRSRTMWWRRTLRAIKMRGRKPSSSSKQVRVWESDSMRA